jgi:hypothetical protein
VEDYRVTITEPSTGTVNSDQKISDTAGTFTGILDDIDFFGSSVASLGDLDSDGVADLVVGAREDDGGGSVFSDRGAVWVLFLNTNGTVKAHQKISDTAGNFTGSWTIVTDSEFPSRCWATWMATAWRIWP